MQTDSNWIPTPFHLQILEGVSGYDETLYTKSVEVLADFFDEQLETTSFDDVSHKSIYNRLMESLELDDVAHTFVTTNINSKIYSPRVQTHFDLYLNNVFPTYNQTSSSFCSKDSFGQTIERHNKHTYFPWVLSNDRIYCTSEDLFAIQITKKSDSLGLLLPFDRIIGSNDDAPVFILFGDFSLPDFPSMLINLLQSARMGKLRFVWRYVPIDSNNSPELLLGYGSSLLLKQSDYHTTDDRHIKTGKASKGSFISQISKNSVNDLGIKFTSLILSMVENSRTKFHDLKTILENFPTHVSKIRDHMVLDSMMKGFIEYNENVGAGDDTIGIYLNGAPVNSLELDVFKLLDNLNDEVTNVQELMNLGFNVEESKLLLSKFALYSAVKQSEFDRGYENRFTVYKDSFNPESETVREGVVFFNDLEKDENYQEFSESRHEAYFGAAAQFNVGQIPALKENIHDLIFVLNLSNRNQLKAFFRFCKIILDRGIPQQVGLLPLGDTELDRKLARYFYFVLINSNPREALAFLYKIFESKSDTFEDVFSVVPYKEGVVDDSAFLNTLNKYSLYSPSVIFNGVIVEMNAESWQIEMGNQLTRDIGTIQQFIQNDISSVSLKDILYKDARLTRNIKIIPKDSSGFKYKKINKELMDLSTLFTTIGDNYVEKPSNFWIVGDLTSKVVIDQLLSIFELMATNAKFDIQLRIIDTSNSNMLKQMKYYSSKGYLSQKAIKNIINLLRKQKINTGSPDLNDEVLNVLSTNELPPHHSFLLFNSRYFRLEIPFTKLELELLLDFEFTQRLAIFDEIIHKYPVEFGGRSLRNFVPEDSDFSDWFDLFCSQVTKSFYVDNNLYLDDVARFDFSSLAHENSFVVGNEFESLVHVLVIIDPLQPSAQELISIVSTVIDFPFVSVEILFQPKLEYPIVPITQFYKGVYPSCGVDFNEIGEYKLPDSITYDNIPDEEVFSLDLHAPKRWFTTTKEVAKEMDLDNIKMSYYESAEQDVTFELSNIVVEGYARDTKSATTPGGVTLQAQKNTIVKNTMIMSNLGYFQLQLGYGSWNLSCHDDEYSLLSATESPFEVNTKPVTEVELNVFSLNGPIIKPRLTKSNGNYKLTKSHKQADINIFTVVSGHLYERLAAIMIRSIVNNTESTIKVWVLENYLSPQFKSLMTKLAQEYNIDYEFVHYKWPQWLREQPSRQRTLWGYKILFLDVLFPQDLNNVIFVDADQINRSNMQELVDYDLGDAPYGFVPMGDSRKDMEGYRFWKQGYWSEVLKDGLVYHISALFKVNLIKFRQLGAGDKLRAHYQKLSSDINSLSNLDQDLPNNMQNIIPIFSLPQEYLWCETWCSNRELKLAKNIDLCNNPMTKESKLDMARRLIPEWKTYDEEISHLQLQLQEQELHQSQVKNSLSNSLSQSHSTPDFHNTPIESSHGLDHDEL